MTPAPVTALLPATDLDRLRTALVDAAYTVDGVTDLLGPAGEAALARADLAGVRRVLRAHRGPLADLCRVFLVGDDVPADAAAAAFGEVPVEALTEAGLLEASGGAVRAAMDVRPHATDAGDGPWWIVSDLGGDVRRGVLRTDHVLGVGPAAMSLADTVVRRPVDRALDVGTGSGVQALHLATHAERIVASDVSERALRCAATTWGLSHPGRDLDLRRGSLLDPVAGERFDQVVANPPFVITPGPTPSDGRFTYRDGGLAGDTLCARLVAGTGAVLSPGGVAQLLANWLVTGEQDWTERVAGWVPDGVDAWVWQREIADLGQYAALWLRDAGDGPHVPGYAGRYDAWVDGLQALGAVAVGFGAVHLRRPADGEHHPRVVVAEDVVQPLQPPLGEAVADWFERAVWLAGPGRDDRTLLATPLRPGPDLLLVRASTPGPEGWVPGASALRQTDGLGWEVEADDATTQVVGACDGTRPLGLLLDLVTATRDDVGAPDAFVARALPVVRDLVARGLLEPPRA
ncbi:DUF7782 domain-containing protein [Jatrophihabitans sp. YIM 134969]